MGISGLDLSYARFANVKKCTFHAKINTPDRLLSTFRFRDNFNHIHLLQSYHTLQE